MKKTEFLNTRKKIEQKNHGMIDKVTTLDQAVNLINNGDTIALGGCLYSRTPIAMIREIIKKKLTDLTIARPIIMSLLKYSETKKPKAVEKIAMDHVAVPMPIQKSIL